MNNNRLQTNFPGSAVVLMNVPSEIVDLQSDDVLGAIHLVRYTDGRVEFTMSGCFKKAPALIAEVIEKIEAANKE
jgi:hypothetical protein